MHSAGIVTPSPDLPITCQIYGLGLQTNLPIAGLRGLPPADTIDVRLRLGEMPAEVSSSAVLNAETVHVSGDLDEDGRPNKRISRLCDGQFLCIDYPDGTRFVIDHTLSTIWASWPEPATVEDTATYLLGPILGYLLRLRGITCLHASSVAIGDFAIALVGPSGAGKSSAAAAFAMSGFAVISDDVVALREQDSGFEVLPAYPRVRLWPESVRALFGSSEALPRITPTWGKRFLDLTGSRHRFHSSPSRLVALYFLGQRTQGPLKIGDLSRSAALVRLVADTFGTKLLDSAQRANEFRVLGRLVNQLPVREVCASDDPVQILELCRAVEADLDTCLRRLRDEVPQGRGACIR